MVQMVLNVCLPDLEVSAEFMGPERMQVFMETLSRPDCKDAALHLRRSRGENALQLLQGCSPGTAR